MSRLQHCFIASHQSLPRTSYIVTQHSALNLTETLLAHNTFIVFNNHESTYSEFHSYSLLLDLVQIYKQYFYRKRKAGARSSYSHFAFVRKPFRKNFKYTQTPNILILSNITVIYNNKFQPP